jgi:transcriptional regulator with XRE-family HTH domain
VINRIRDIRRQKDMTLADVAERCVPPTTAQTIGRLETGTRTLSIGWVNRIAGALGVDPDLLVRGDEAEHPMIVARLLETGPEALNRPAEAILPSALVGEGRVVALAIEAGAGEYRVGDQLWLREVESDDFARLLNRDVLAPRPAGRFAFGRMIDRDGKRVALLPPGVGKRQVVIDNPAWLAVAEMLIRKL